MRRAFVAGMLFLVLGAVPSSTFAQEAGPTAGTWGAEAGLGGANVSLLRFRSPTSAWILGFVGQLIDIDDDADGAFSFDETLANVQLRLGVRRYSQPAQRFRPFSSFAAIAGYQDAGGAGWRFGGDVELGGAYFFSPHVSLGTSAFLAATFERGEREIPLTGEVNTREIVASTGIRFLGAVYF